MGNIKQVIVVRTDLEMGKGKIAAQVGHACVLGTENVRTGPKELENVKNHAIDLDLPWSEVTDAGHTQIAPGTTTCISLGPAPEELINKVTGDLKLL
jgi:PTH2 family peptidyl-tRNA hydrolase